jgi:hypothetical protein
VKSGTAGALKAYENWMAKNAKRDNPLAGMPVLMETYWQKIIDAPES